MDVIQTVAYCTVIFIVVVLTSVSKHSGINTCVCEPPEVNGAVNCELVMHTRENLQAMVTHVVIQCQDLMCKHGEK